MRKPLAKSLRLIESRKPRTEEVFADGSRLVHTEDGGWLILESDLAACNVVGLAHDRPVRYDEPPPLPPAKCAKA